MQPNRVNIYAKASSETVNKIMGAKTIIWPRFNTIRNIWA